ncbi:MAG: GNAT family N-acetyltransferase [Bacteroidales bacterium]|nr:GNAT family N-acetyltransferase [Bacteroidales bacterium]
MNNIQIKKITTNDIHQLQKISRQTFYETFVAENSKADMDKYLNENFSFDQLKTELLNEFSEFYFAMHENEVVGYLKINLGEAQNELKDCNSMEIERIYVSKEFHGKQAGQVLFEKALEISRRENVEFVWLGVWERNYRAQRFYEKNGFIKFDKHIFMLGDDVQTDIMMKLQMH